MLPPDATVEEAAKQMLERGIPGLIVVDAKGELARLPHTSPEPQLVPSASVGTVQRAAGVYSSAK